MSAVLGVSLGLAGIAIIATPSILHGGTGQLQAYALLGAAAATWAISIVFVRAHRFAASPLVLAPWQTLLAAVLLFPLAIGFEGPLPGIGAVGVASLAYVAPVATALAYWAIVEAGRQFRPTTISMALLAVPVLGILISASMLGEAVDSFLAGGVLLIGAGIRLAR